MIALALGGASTVWDDLRAFNEFGIDPDLIVACNDMIAKWPLKLDAACTLHPEKYRTWLPARAAAGYSVPNRIFSFLHHHDFGFERICYKFDGQTETGSSGLFATKCAFEIGATKVIACGMPMTRTPHFFDAEDWKGYDQNRVGWIQALPQIAHRVRSMSGWTRELLGAPTVEWINADLRRPA